MIPYALCSTSSRAAFCSSPTALARHMATGALQPSVSAHKPPPLQHTFALQHRHATGLTMPQSKTQQGATLKGEEVKKIYWRPTQDRWFDYNFSEDEVAQLKKEHRKLFLEDKAWLWEGELEGCVTHTPPKRYTKWQKLKYTFDRYIRKGQDHYTGSYALLAKSRAADPKLLELFQIDPKDFAQRGYFLIMHTWLLHRRLLIAGHASVHYFFWEMIWNDFMFKIRYEENVSEFRASSALKDVQQYALGFCLALDECLDHDDRWAGQLKYVLWGNVFSGKIPRDDPRLERLTVYLMHHMQFVMGLPDDVFDDVAFKWPAWPPPKKGIVPPFDDSLVGILKPPVETAIKGGESDEVPVVGQEGGEKGESK
eukprot:GDKI01019692.1.p1 GENE.GDKI01019692.1~~GDKI01019692.1.p1  ORF type:complete len:368 (+),score=57.49 GDKI01019692.1:183-1286(+)